MRTIVDLLHTIDRPERRVDPPPCMEVRHRAA
jgi:hypothetical protein